MSDDIINKIYDKVEKIAEDVQEMKVTAVVHEETLKLHVKRSDTLEALYKDIKESDIEPLKKDINFFKSIYKVFVGVGTIATMILTILKLFKKI